MSATAEHGYVLIADISGYTRFLTQSELEHAHAIIKELLSLLRDQMGAPVQIIRTEGDALFGYVRAETLDDAPWLLDLVEAAYHAFRQRLFQVEVASTCECNACTNTQELDLKFFAHHAEFIVEDLGGGRPDLSGPEVILAHRLLKNEFVAKHGVPAYFMVTAPVFEGLGTPEDAIAHSESFEHFGDVALHVFDLTAAHERRRTKQRVVVVKEHADVWLEFTFPGPRQYVWNLMTDPKHIAGFNDDITGWTWKGDRRNVGIEAHCAHGDGTASLMQVSDWTPMEHYTVTTRALGNKWPSMQLTYHFRELPQNRTMLCMGARMLKPNLRQQMALKMFKGKWLGATRKKWEEMAGFLAERVAEHDRPAISA
jgi:hypothetical protein